MPKHVELFASRIVTLDSGRGRLALPVEVIKSAGWENVAADEALTTEFVSVGHFRLHRSSDVRESIDRMAKSLRQQAQSVEEAQVCLQVLADQFREIQFYPKDNNRVLVRDETVMWLFGEEPPAKACRLYVQAGTNVIDVMTHEMRMRRLKEFIESNHS